MHLRYPREKKRENSRVRERRVGEKEREREKVGERKTMSYKTPLQYDNCTVRLSASNLQLILPS